MNPSKHAPDRRTALKMAAAFSAPLMLPSIARAQAAPSKPIKIVVAFPPGGSNDVMGRLLSAELAKGYAPLSLVENRPGAGGVVAAQNLMQSPADGTSLLLVSFPFPLINSVYKQTKIDVRRDFTPIALLGVTSNIVAVRAESPYKSMQDLLEAGKKTPNKITFASTGNGTSPHLGMELIMQQTGTKFVHVPYKGSTPALTDLLAGQVDFTVDNISNALPHIRAGKMRAFAVTTAERASVLPEVPTLREAGVKDVVMDIWFGIVAPAGVPAPVVASLNAELSRIVNQNDIKARLADLGIQAGSGSAQELGRIVAADVDKWAKVVQEAGITAQ